MSKQQQFFNILKDYIPNPDALLWLVAYVAYCHSIDDIIDQEDYSDHDFILKTFRMSISLFCYPFFQQHQAILRPLLEVAHDSYRDSVVLEKDYKDKLWAQRVGDVIRQNANDVVLAVIMITSGLDVRNQAAIKLRELSYNTHHDKENKPV